jgi:hypothetical protein
MLSTAICEVIAVDFSHFTTAIFEDISRYSHIL